MNLDEIFGFVSDFSKESHGKTDYYKNELFIMGVEPSFAPLTFVQKSMPELEVVKLQKLGFVIESLELMDDSVFRPWFENQFSRKLTRKILKSISIAHNPNNKEIFDTLSTVNRCYEILENEKIIINAKKLPVQVGEWYCKCIFGLVQKKSTSQRGFDFYLGEKRVEVKIQWGDATSPKGIKLRKSLVELSDYSIIMYVAKNLMIREVCFLDSSYVIRKFSGKGHTLFLKDSDIQNYFFSKSTKQLSKVVNTSALMKFSAPALAMNMAEGFPG